MGIMVTMAEQQQKKKDRGFIHRNNEKWMDTWSPTENALDEPQSRMSMNWQYVKDQN
jgi:hypothetical protein